MHPNQDRARRKAPALSALPWCAAALAAALVVTAGASAQTPQSLPGIIVTTTPPAAPPGVMITPPPGAGPAPPAPTPPAAAPKPKPKPKVAAKPKDPAPGTGEAGGTGTGGSGTRIALLVNGEPITAYEIDQRARLMALQENIGGRAQENMKALAKSESVNARWKQIVEETIKANQATKTREQIIAMIQERQKAFAAGLQKQAVESARASVMPGLREKARKELIEELVKLQEAKAAGATPDEAAVDEIVKDIAGRNKLTPQQFAQHFAGMGIDIATFRARFRAQQAWTEAVRRKYGHLVTANNRDIDRLVQNDAAGEDQLELQLQRIVVPIPPKLDQKSMAQRLAEAEQLQQQFQSCRNMSALSAKVAGSRFESIGVRRPSNFSEPTRSMLLNAKDEEMLAPTMTSGGIELIAVCSRKVVKATEEKRNQKANELRQEQFERLSRKHLRDLMDSAVIETR